MSERYGMRQGAFFAGVWVFGFGYRYYLWGRAMARDGIQNGWIEAFILHWPGLRLRCILPTMVKVPLRLHTNQIMESQILNSQRGLESDQSSLCRCQERAMDNSNASAERLPQPSQRVSYTYRNTVPTNIRT